MNLRRFFSVFALGAALVLSACATTGAPAVSGAAATSNGNKISQRGQLYGDYLSGSYASASSDVGASATYYNEAYRKNPGNASLGASAMTAALANGDFSKANKIAGNLLEQNEISSINLLVKAIDALRAGNEERALNYLKSANVGGEIDNFVYIVRGWTQLGLGEPELARSEFASVSGNRYFDLLGQLQLANFALQTGQYEQIEPAIKDIEEIGVFINETVLLRTHSAMAQNDKAAALKVLKAFEKEYGGAPTGPIRRVLDRIEADTYSPPKHKPNQLAADAFLLTGISYFAPRQQNLTAEIFMQLAHWLDPENDRALLFIGSVREQSGRADDALSILSDIKEGSDFLVSARITQAQIHYGRDEDEKGNAILHEMDKNSPSPLTRELLANAYLGQEKYKKALPYIDTLIADTTLAEREADPSAHYLKGICLERLGRWEEAVPEFEFVLKHKPDDANALNYLGYTWVDKGTNLDRAFKMIRKAVEKEPKSGAIIDSLGWAQYKLGQYGEARRNLEKAASLDPGSATIIDHLGDVYWRLGRRVEAVYQWERALTLEPTEDEKATIHAKLKGGLSASLVNKS